MLITEIIKSLQQDFRIFTFRRFYLKRLTVTKGLHIGRSWDLNSLIFILLKQAQLVSCKLQ